MANEHTLAVEAAYLQLDTAVHAAIVAKEKQQLTNETLKAVRDAFHVLMNLGESVERLVDVFNQRICSCASL
jgi:hypothetical protein